MTEDGWKLRTRVEFEVAQIELRKPSAGEALAAISAVLDGLDEMADQLPVSWPGTIREFTAHVREEVGIAPPVAPQDAPNAPGRSHGPETT